MGSFTSSPAIPQSQTVVVNEESSTEEDDGGVSGEESEELASEARQDSLLVRDRGRSGTISTGFLGLLDENDNDQRKTLLGE